MARELNTRERQLCVTIAEQKPSRRATQRHPASEPVILTWIPAAAQVRAPSARHQPTSIAAARSQTTASSPRGTFSQAELTDERVITRRITRPVPVTAATIRAMPDALEKLPVHVPLAAPNAGPATLAAELLRRVRAEPSGRAWILAEVKLCSFGAPGDWAHSCAP
jgi:hypothetical protein